MKKTIVVILLIFALIASFLLGANITKTQIEKSADQMQAELSFGHLDTYQNLQSDILSECMSRAKSRLEFAIDEQKMLMAEYVQSIRNEDFEKYINIRDSDLIQELLSYEVNWKKTWPLPDCVAEKSENS